MKLKQKSKHLTGISIYLVHSLSEFEVKKLSRPQHQRQVQKEVKRTRLNNVILLKT